MSKIIAGILGLVLISATTVSVAQALFSSQAVASAVSFTTGNADLKIWDGDTFESEWNPSNLVFAGLYPGFGGTGADESTSTEYETFYLKNLSSSPVSLNIVGKLRDGVVEDPAGSWNVLKDKVLVAILLPDWSGGTGWHTLAEWNATGFPLPGTPLDQNVQQEYRFYVRVDGTTGNEIAGQSISAIHFDFDGTQVE